MIDKTLFIKDVFNLIRIEFPEFSKIPIGLNTSNYSGRNPQQNISYVDCTFDKKSNNVENININIINDFSEVLSLFESLSESNLWPVNEYESNQRDYNYIKGIGEELSQEILIVLQLLGSFGNIHCILKFKELLNIKDFELVISTNIDHFQMSQNSDNPYPLNERNEIEDNSLFINLYSQSFKYQHFIRIWNKIKNEISVNNQIVFKVGKYYKHSTGEKVYIIGYVDAYNDNDRQLVVKSNRKSDLMLFGTDPSCTVNWYEISQDEYRRL